MEWMEGADLLSQLSQRFLCLADKIECCLQAAQGLEYLHDQGFLHGDLAARNCLVRPNFDINFPDIMVKRKTNFET